MNINGNFLDKLGGAQPELSTQSIQVSLFVVSKNNPRLKKLDLSGLRSEQRLQKLRQLAEENRLVAVIQIGNEVFAHAHKNMSKQLESQKDLTINGKAVSVKTLNEEEYQQLAQMALEESSAKDDQEVEKEKEHGDKSMSFSSYSSTRYAFGVKSGHPLRVDHVIARIKLSVDQILLNVIRRMEEVRQEQKEAEMEQKYFETRKEHIRKNQQKSEITKEAIKHQELETDKVVEHVEHVQRTRGIEA